MNHTIVIRLLKAVILVLCYHWHNIFTLCLGPQRVTVVWIRGQCQSVACAELPRTGPGLGWSCLQTPPSRACWSPSPPQDPLRRKIKFIVSDIHILGNIWLHRVHPLLYLLFRILCVLNTTMFKCWLLSFCTSIHYSAHVVYICSLVSHRQCQTSTWDNFFLDTRQAFVTMYSSNLIPILEE